MLRITDITEIPVVGLCYSVQGTSHRPARYAGVTNEEMEWECAGVNHLAWFTKLMGDDAVGVACMIDRNGFHPLRPAQQYGRRVNRWYPKLSAFVALVETILSPTNRPR